MKKSLIILLYSSFVNFCFPQAGALDVSFDLDGIAITNMNIGFDQVNSILIQPDSKILAGGVSEGGIGTNPDFAIARYLHDGSLDTTFGAGGRVYTNINNKPNSIMAMALQEDGKIIAVGGTLGLGTYLFTLARYKTNGTLDSTFGTFGIVVTPIGSEPGIGIGAEDIAIQDDGKIVVVGNNYVSDPDFVIIRYNSDGTLDNTFAEDGIMTHTIYEKTEGATAVALQADGKIVIVGITYDFEMNTLIARYNTDGSIDETFGIDGFQTSPTGIHATLYDVAIQADGKIIAIGYSETENHDIFLTRLNVDGSLDLSFSDDGIVTTEIGILYEEAKSLAIQEDGKILVTGHCKIGPLEPDEIILLRYNSDGVLDNTFDTDGIVRTIINESFWNQGEAIAIQPDGKIIVGAGHTAHLDGVSNNVFTVVRYLQSAPIDAGVELVHNQEFKLFPNPATDNITIELKALGKSSNLQLEIHDIIGQKIYSTPIQDGQTMINIDINMIPAGVYFIHVLGEGNTLFVKNMIVN